MERFVLERRIPIDIWREIKTYLVHNIKTQSKHMKKEKNVIKFNSVLRKVPRIRPPPTGPIIVFRSVLDMPYRMVKYIYHVQAFKPVEDAVEPYRDGKITVIVNCKTQSHYPSLDDLANYTNFGHQQDYNKHFVSCAVPFHPINS
jgi:hypothetical protein